MRQNGEKMSENNDTINNQEEEYEKICYICRRPESKAGKMIAMPGNVYVCQDCLQKTFGRSSAEGSLPARPGPVLLQLQNMLPFSYILLLRFFTFQ